MRSCPPRPHDDICQLFFKKELYSLNLFHISPNILLEAKKVKADNEGPDRLLHGIKDKGVIMSVPAINTNTNYYGSYSSTASKAGQAAAGEVQKEVQRDNEKSGQKVAAKTDTYEKSRETNTEKYTEPKRLTAEQLKKLQEQQTASFTKMLSSMLNNQADKAKLAYNGLSADLFKNITVTEEQRLEAEKAISEDGEWGVNAVATRIMDMASALSGGDSSKVSVLREAVEKGFKQAGVQWGASLPSITDKTHDEINKRFDYWEENGSLDGYEYEAE